MNINEKENGFDRLEILIVILSVLFLLFSFIAPWLFTQFYWEGLDFSDSGAIGDTIGGVMNPFVALAGVLLTFLAFYIQFKANYQQRKALENALNKEKVIEHNNHRTNINMVKALINSMLNHFKNAGEYLSDYMRKEEENPLKMNIYSYSTYSSFENFSKLNLRDIYASITYSFEGKNEGWEKEFIDTLTTIDFYDKLLKELISKNEKHSASKFEKLVSIGDILNEYSGVLISDNELKKLDGIIAFKAIVLNIDSDNKPIVDQNELEGTDFSKLKNLFLDKFIPQLINLAKSTNAAKYYEVLDVLSRLNKKIGVEKSQSVNYAANLKEIHSRNFEDENNFIKIRTFLAKLNIPENPSILK